MSSMSAVEKRQFERLFPEMESGYVLDFTHKSFEAFFLDEFEIDVGGAKYCPGCSTARQLRAFWSLEEDHIVGPVLAGLLDLYEKNRPAKADANAATVVRCRQTIARMSGGTVSTAPLRSIARESGLMHLRKQVDRAEEHVHSDPTLAIGTAKEIVETCCKTILTERGVPFTKGDDASALTRLVLKELALVPDAIPDPSEGRGAVRRLLSNLGEIGNNIERLRDLYGTGHGKQGDAKGLEPRHARLAVAAASSFASFLFETHGATRSG